MATLLTSRCMPAISRRLIVSLPPRHLKSHLASAQGCRVATTGVIVLIIHRLHEDD